METENDQTAQIISKKSGIFRMITVFIGIVIIGVGAWFWKHSKIEPTKTAQNREESNTSIGEDNGGTEQNGVERESGRQRQAPRTAPSQPVMTQPNQPTAQYTSYTDGTYTAIGNYYTPAGAEEVGISLTLKNALITDTQYTNKAVSPTSRQWQNMFGTGYRDAVIGKSISDLSLVAVSGASLTTNGFMDALEKIKQQAGK